MVKDVFDLEGIAIIGHQRGVDVDALQNYSPKPRNPQRFQWER